MLRRGRPVSGMKEALAEGSAGLFGNGSSIGGTPMLL